MKWGERLDGVKKSEERLLINDNFPIFMGR